MRITLAGLSFAASVRMINRIHRQASDRRSDSQPAASAGFSDASGLMLDITDLADGGMTLQVYQPYFS